MKVVIAPDSFKGSMSATAVARSIADAIRSLHPGWRAVEVPMADGGEGTVDAVLSAVPGRRVSATVKSPLWADVKAEFAVLSEGGTAVIEMAQASGLTLVPESERNPLRTTTFGTGQLVRRAVEEGCRRIYIGIGGSATVDGGAGMATALGVMFLDAEGKDIPLGGGGLSRLSKIDLSYRIDISGLTVTALSDVTNPLLGESGAASVFGPQKGATPEMVAILERNLAHLARVIKRDLGIEVGNTPGAGAAGGLGAGIAAFLDGDIQSGVGALVELVGLREKVRDADLVITGEGKLDRQTGTGKAPMGVAKVASELGVPVVAVCGSLGEETPQDVKDSFVGILSLTEIAGSEECAMRRPEELLKEAVARFCNLCPPPWGKGRSRQPLAGRRNTDVTISSLLERLDGVKTESHRNNPGEI